MYAYQADVVKFHLDADYGNSLSYLDEIVVSKENIFDKLRINGDEQSTTPNVNTQIPGQEINKQSEIKPESPIINSETQKENSPQEFNNIYDLRFAINNFRQAIQNTEKFGFKVKADEYDSPDKYQIVIEIDKKN